MTDPFADGPRAARPAHLPPVWPPLDPATGLVDPFDEADPPDGFFVDPDIARRMADATTVAQGLPPDEALRDSNRKLSDLTRAEWDLAVRRRAYEEAREFSFLDPPEGVEPVLAELSPVQVASLDGFTRDTALRVDFPAEYGGYLARIHDPVEQREVGVVPRTVVLAAAADAAVPRMSETGVSAPDSEPAGRDDEEGGLSRFLTSERLRDVVLDMIPVIGHGRAAVDAYESYSEAIKALRQEDWDAFVDHGGMGLLNTLGVIGGPVGAPLVRIAKHAIRELVRKTPVAGQGAAAIGLGLAKNRFHKKYDPIQVDKTLGKVFRDATDEQRKIIKGVVPNAIGKAAERQAIRQAEDAGQTVTKQGSRTTTSIEMGGRTVTRRHDAFIEVQRNFFVDVLGIFDRHAKTAALEVKAQASYSGRQMKRDRAIAADGSRVQQVVHARYPIKTIPEKDLESALRDMFAPRVTGKPGALTQKQVDAIVRKFVRLRRGHGDIITADLFAATLARLATNEWASNAEDHRRREAERQAE